METLWRRVWWWNGGAHTVVVPTALVDEMLDQLKGEGFYCWVTPEFRMSAPIGDRDPDA
jgi:hypothetical protein